MFPLVMICFFLVPGTEVNPIRHWLPQLEKLEVEERLNQLLVLAEEALKEHPERALAGAQLALKWSRSGNFTDQRLEALFLLGRAQRVAKQTDQAIEKLEGAWLLSLQLNRDDLSDLIHRELSSTLYNAGDYERAMTEERRFITFAEEKGNRKGKAQSLNDIGVLYKKMGNLIRAEDYHRRALELRREIKDVDGEGQSLSNLGIILKNQGNYSRSLDYQLQAIALIEAGGNRRRLANALNNVGIIYKHLGDFREAINWHQKAYKINQELDQAAKLAITLSNLADNHIHLEEYDKAKAYLEQGLAIKDKGGDIAGMVLDLVQMATLHLEQEQVDEAAGFLARAERQAGTIGNVYIRARVNMEQGKLALHQGSPASAMEKLNLALDQALLIQNRPMQRDIYHLLVEVYRHQGNTSEALVKQTKFIELNKELINTESRGKIANIQAEFDMEKARQELELLRKDRQIQQMAMAWQKLWRNVVLLAILFLIMLAAILYNRFRLKNRAYEILSEKSAQISQQKVALEEANGALRQKTDLLEDMNEQLYRASVTDSLTGIYNRTFIMEALEREVTMSNRHGISMSILMIDLDHFKRINDQYGHQAGDEVLRAASKVMSELIRREDMLARYGGEEFIIGLPNTSGDQAMLVAEKIREGVASHSFDYQGHEISVGISIGVAEIADLEAASLPELIRSADGALYRAKEKGRNRTEAFAASV